MGYINGNKILPEELINRIQDYIEGECIYIPKSKKHCKAWGEEAMPGLNWIVETVISMRDIFPERP